MSHSKPDRAVGRRRLVVALAGALATLVLAACSTGGGVGANTTVDVRIVDPEGVRPYAVSQIMAGASITSLATYDDGAAPSALAPAGFVEVQTGLWLGNTVDASAGATVEIALPNEDEIPSGTLANADQAFVNATVAPDCTVVASDPTVQLTTVLFESFAVPGLVASAGVVGLAPVFLSDASFDPDAATLPDGLRIYTWIHADGDVDVTFDGADCDGFDADVNLTSGWNVEAWVYDSGTTGWTLSDAEAPETLVGTVPVF